MDVTSESEVNETTILFLAANPLSSGRLSLDEEARDIERRIQTTSCRIPLRFRTRWAVRPDDVLLALNEDRPVVVHFSGHGSAATGLVFHDDAGRAAIVSGKALRRVFKTLEDNIRVVFLNACYSEEQASFIREAVDCVVGMGCSIDDKIARVFAAAFYRALGHGRDVQNAFDQGLAALELEGFEAGNVPCLLVRDGVAASNVFLKRLPRLNGHDEARSDPAGRDARCRCTITLVGSLQDLDPALLVKLTELLKRYSGDVNLTIEKLTEGSIRLTVLTTKDGRANLAEAARQGVMADLAGFRLVSVETEGPDERPLVAVCVDSMDGPLPARGSSPPAKRWFSRRVLTSLAAATLAAAAAMFWASGSREMGGGAAVPRAMLPTLYPLGRVLPEVLPIERARQAMQAEEWSAALAAAKPALEEDPTDLVVQALVAQAERELANQPTYERFQAAVASRDHAGVAGLYKRLDPDSIYRAKAQVDHDRLKEEYVQRRIRKGRWMGSRGRCRDQKEIADQVGRLWPDSAHRVLTRRCTQPAPAEGFSAR